MAPAWKTDSGPLPWALCAGSEGNKALHNSKGKGICKMASSNSEIYLAFLL
jgi:hypothetical protein